MSSGRSLLRECTRASYQVPSHAPLQGREDGESPDCQSEETPRGNRDYQGKWEMYILKEF